MSKARTGAVEPLTADERARRTAMTFEFKTNDHGTVWTIRAMTPQAIAFAEDSFDIPSWAGCPAHFSTDWRPARDLCERLVEDGFSVEFN